MTTPTPDVRENAASTADAALVAEMDDGWYYCDHVRELVGEHVIPAVLSAVTPVIRQQVAEEIAQAIDARSAAAYRGEFGYNDWDTGLVREGLDDAAAVARSHVQHRTEEQDHG
jgi:hypothetical protein